MTSLGGSLEDFVGRRVSALQHGYLRGDSSARSTLAALRSSVTKPLAQDPQLWSIIFDSFPYSLAGVGDEPSKGEQAAATALALFAVHMQSATRPMHVPGIGLGSAIRKMAGRPSPEGQESPIIKRFHALGTSVSFDEASYHARGLIQQLRGAAVPLDYGRLARDFFYLQTPTAADSVRLRWARDLYRWDDNTNEQNPATEQEA